MHPRIKITKQLIKTLNLNQKDVFDKMLAEKILQICLPTGVGKGYVMNVHIRHDLIKDISDIVTISSHRLILNTQHLADLIAVLKDMIEDVRFIFVGSSPFNHDRLDEDKFLRKVFYKHQFTSKDLVKQTTSMSAVNKWVEEFRADNKKVVIISTYHSLHKLRELKLGAIYCDEAHALASEDSTNVFKKNFSCLNFKKSYFLTATPKDGVEDNPYSFLMNNEDIFGHREQMNVREAYKLGYITKPVVHMAVPENYNNEDMNQLRNKVKFIIHTFGTHEKFVKEATDTPELIGGKLLIKCESVDVMWKIYDSLLNKNLQNIDLFAGASRKGTKGSPSYQKNGVDVPKSDHLVALQQLKSTDRAIVLHVNTLSEGVNVKTFTGSMFLTNHILTVTSILQSIGRSTRVLDIDRKNLKNGSIEVGDEYKGWLKPYAFVILPVYDPESKHTAEYVSNLIKELKMGDRDSNYVISIGDDMCKGKNLSQDPLVDLYKLDKNKKLVKKIVDIIENDYISSLEIKTQSKINQMDDSQLLELLKAELK